MTQFSEPLNDSRKRTIRNWQAYVGKELFYDFFITREMFQAAVLCGYLISECGYVFIGECSQMRHFVYSIPFEWSSSTLEI